MYTFLKTLVSTLILLSLSLHLPSSRCDHTSLMDPASLSPSDPQSLALDLSSFQLSSLNLPCLSVPQFLETPFVPPFLLNLSDPSVLLATLKLHSICFSRAARLSPNTLPLSRGLPVPVSLLPSCPRSRSDSSRRHHRPTQPPRPHASLTAEIASTSGPQDRLRARSLFAPAAHAIPTAPPRPHGGQRNQ